MAAVNVSLDPAASSIALLALAATGYFGWRQVQLQKRVTTIEEARYREELALTRRANVTAQFYKKREQDPFFPSFWVTLKNAGSAPAGDVTISIPNADKYLRPGVTVDPEALPIPGYIPARTFSSSSTSSRVRRRRPT